jgi:hypothetical protein
VHATFITVFTLVALVGTGLAVCIASDRLEQRWRLKKFRRASHSQPDIPDDQFSSAFTEIEAPHVLEMRRMLAALLGIDPRKIQAGWRFREERNLKNIDLFIFHAFAQQYAPDLLRDHRPFAFPTREVSTVRDFFLEVWRLHTGG